MKALQKIIAAYCRESYFKLDKERKIQIGVYYPSMLVGSCYRSQYNFYTQYQGKKNEELPDEVILKLAGGVVFHRILQNFKLDGKKYWDAIEVPCEYSFDTGKGKILIRGRIDAIKDNVIHEFKHTYRIPQKAKFQHLLQLQFYLGAMQKARGQLDYIGYDEYGMVLREFPVIYSQWHFEHLLNRAVALHLYLRHKEPPKCGCRTQEHEYEERS